MELTRRGCYTPLRRFRCAGRSLIPRAATDTKAMVEGNPERGVRDREKPVDDLLHRAVATSGDHTVVPRAAAPADRASASPNRPVTSTRASGRESSRSRSQPTDRMARPLPATGLTMTMGAIDTQGIVTIRVNHHGALPYPA